MTLAFRSTRGIAPDTDIKTAILSGLAPDGGLYVPRLWPQFNPSALDHLKNASYCDLALHILAPFFDGILSEDVLEKLIEKSYAFFEKRDVVNLSSLGPDLQILELFHGPSLAFKDIALQLLATLLDHFGGGRDEPLTLIGATSGDTGSAAIAALSKHPSIDVFILFPEKGPTEIQRKQMTCMPAPNIHAIAIQGNFDDCQAIVKKLSSQEYLRKSWGLTTVNSINILRILAQMVYYFYTSITLNASPCFVVPTGNFGDIYAGYASYKCGLPVSKLVIATNSNDVLKRFFETGTMMPHPVQSTLSPSMDIQLSSNFERLLLDICDNETVQVRDLMEELRTQSRFSVTTQQLLKAFEKFCVGSSTDSETMATIASIYESYGYILDPHTAVGVQVAQKLSSSLSSPVVCLATAHPAKFPQTIRQAIGHTPVIPSQLSEILLKEEKFTTLPADAEKVSAFIERKKVR